MAGLAGLKLLAGLASCLLLLQTELMWEGPIPLFANLVVLASYGTGAWAVRQWPAAALVLSCTGAAYASRPLAASGWEISQQLLVEGFAGLGLWLLVLETPSPLKVGRQIVLAGAGFNSAAATFSVFGNLRFLPLERFGAETGLQVFDLTLPLGALALTLLFGRAVFERSNVGLAFVVGFGPLVAQLLVEWTVPAYQTWANAHREAIAGVVTGLLILLPLWILVFRPRQARLCKTNQEIPLASPPAEDYRPHSRHQNH